MKGRTLGRISTKTGQLVRTYHALNAGRTTRPNSSTPRVRPRVSSSTNDNQCVIQLKPLLLTGSPPRETMNTMNTILNAKLNVVNSVHTAFSKERSPGAAGCYSKRNKLKSVKSVSCVIPLSYVSSQCCHKSACRGQTPKLLEKVVRPRSWTESGPNHERGLHPPLSDPAKLIKNSHSHKLLWQSSQKLETVRDITSAYGQKCHRTSPQTDLTRVFQPTIFSPKTQEQMEADLRPKQSEFFPQDRKIQDGDTGNHQDLTPTGRVGNLHRLQGCLLPFSNTGTIQEILEISYPRPNLSVQSTTVWPVNSAHGVHCNSQGGETDGHSKGYKDPPIP